jgi:hypothetical protein
MKIELKSMKHIKMFESWDSAPAETERTLRTPMRNPVPDLSPLKDTAEYQDLIASGFIDVSDGNPMGLRQGNLRFTHPALGEDIIRVNGVGSITIDKPSGKTHMVDKGSSLTSIEDYAVRFARVKEILPLSDIEYKLFK